MGVDVRIGGKPMYRDDERKPRGLFGALFDPQTYKNLLYLFLSFPLGLGYFLFLVIGVSLGAGLAVIGIGIPILVGVLFGAVGLIGFERRLANALLDTDIPVYEPLLPPGASVLARLKAQVFNMETLKGIGYLFVRFPMGILALILSVLTVALPLSLITAPFSYQSADIHVVERISTPEDALFAAVIGLVLAPVMLWLVNKLMAAWRQFTLAMLGTIQPEYETYSKSKRDYEVAEKPKHAYDDDGVYDYPVHRAEPIRLQESEKPKRSLSDLIEAAMEDRKAQSDGKPGNV